MHISLKITAIPYPISILVIGVCFLFISCKEHKQPIQIPEPVSSAYGVEAVHFSKEAYYDRVLGALVGSAIGDAMGASTEMWNRTAIQQQYGYILGLTPAVREQSPEGPWKHNLPAGATTDDTRWKYLMVKYYQQHQEEINAKNFASFIGSYYTDVVKTLSANDILTETDRLEAKIKKIYWIKEWARVALAYSKNDSTYFRARDRFYGGEMSCAGLLYTPMFGLLAPNSITAYNTAYEHSIFDIGYAKDISSIAAAMSNMALQTKDIDSILNAAIFIDPLGYQDSRLVGRISLNIAISATNTVHEILEIDQIPPLEKLVQNDSLLLINTDEGIAVQLHKDSIKLKIPRGFPGKALDWYRQEKLYQALEKDQKAIAFHAGEIWQILYTALKFGDGDFMSTLQFIINYGRDNDTVAAIAGMILGAKEGFNNLPNYEKTEILRIHKEHIGIDLEILAQELVEVKYP